MSPACPECGSHVYMGEDEARCDTCDWHGCPYCDTERIEAKMQELESKLGAAEQKLAAAEGELGAAREELARIQRWPTLDWAKAKTVFVQRLARLAREGDGATARSCVAALDGLSRYVNKLENELEEVRHGAQGQDSGETDAG